MASRNDDTLLSSDRRLRKFSRKKNPTRGRSLITIHTTIRSQSTSTSTNGSQYRKVINTFHSLFCRVFMFV